MSEGSEALKQKHKLELKIARVDSHREDYPCSVNICLKERFHIWLAS